MAGNTVVLKPPTQGAAAGVMMVQVGLFGGVPGVLYRKPCGFWGSAALLWGGEPALGAGSGEPAAGAALTWCPPPCRRAAGRPSA